MWRQSNLTLRGIGGRPKIMADGASAQNKAIWVIKGNNTVVENIEFSGSTVPDGNGGDIRQEGRNLIVRNCFFHDNEEGILVGHDANSYIVIENSEFANNGYGDGQTHNMYIGKVKSFTLRHSYSHHANIGHLIKSRARINHILYNRLMDEVTGNSSYVINLPFGGQAYIIGNIIQQGKNTDNPYVISIAEEVAKYSEQDVYLINNTIINDKLNGHFIRIKNEKTKALLVNNIFVGRGRLLTGPGKLENNLRTNTAGFVSSHEYNFKLMPFSPAINKGKLSGEVNGIDLTPVSHYIHSMKSEPRPKNGNLDIGAFEYSGTK